MTPDRKFVALSVHSWADLNISYGPGFLTDAHVSKGPGLGFLIVYATREEAEAAEPRAEIIEVAPCGAGGGE